MIRRGWVVIMIRFSTAVISTLLTQKESAGPCTNRILLGSQILLVVILLRFLPYNIMAEGLGELY